MKLKLNNKYVKWGLTAFLVIAAGITFYYVVFHISDIIQNIKGLFNVIMPVVFGAVIAYLLTPILNYFEKKLLNPLFDKLKIKKTEGRRKWIRAIGIILTTVLTILLIYALIAMLVSQIVPSIQDIVSNFDGYVSGVYAWLNSLLEDNQELRSFIMPLLSNISDELDKWLTDTATLLAKSSEVLKTVSLSIIGFLKVAWNFILGFVIAIYMLASKESFSAQSKKIIYAVFEKKTANEVLSSFRFVHRTFIGFISGKVLDSIIIGLLCSIGTTILGTPYAVLVSVIVGVTNVIPFFGPYLGAIPSAILILVVDLSHPMHCVTFLIFILFLQQLDGNVIGPKILGDSTGLSGFWVIFSITVFGGLFGVMGMVVGVPIFAIIFAAVKALVNRSLKKKKMPLDTALYLTVSTVDKNGTFITLEEEASTEKHEQKSGDNGSFIGKLFKRKKNKGNVTDTDDNNMDIAAKEDTENDADTVNAENTTENSNQSIENAMETAGKSTDKPDKGMLKK